MTRSAEHANGGCATFAVELDFAAKNERTIPLAACKQSMAEGRFCWIDVDVSNQAEARTVIAGLGLVPDVILEAALTHEPSTELAQHDDDLHLVLTGCRLGQHIDLDRVDLILGKSFLLTLHRGTAGFLDMVKRIYRADFYRFAKSPSFLVYEIWDHLIDSYHAVQKQLEERVIELQSALRRDVDERTFARASELGTDVLRFRKVLVPARAVLSELSTRKSAFISEATQPFLGNMVGTLDRVLGDLQVDREVLSESLTLYMSMAAHRSNETMRYLAVMSAVFLPLAFVVGFFGQNFENFPGLAEWVHSDSLMWLMIVTCVMTPVVMLGWFKKKKWL